MKQCYSHGYNPQGLFTLGRSECQASMHTKPDHLLFENFSVHGQSTSRKEMFEVVLQAKVAICF